MVAFLLLSSNLTVSTGLTATGKQFKLVQANNKAGQFEFVDITLLVKDIDGNPIAGADVKAFSEDWKYSHPYARAIFNHTGSDGSLIISIPVGNWSFFAAGGWSWISSHPGQGYFSVLLNVEVTTDVTLLLKPDDRIIASIYDINGTPLDANIGRGQVRLMESDHVPIVNTVMCGATLDGNISLQVSGGLHYDMLIVKRPDDKPGYILHQKKIASGSSIEVRPTSQTTSHLTFRIHDKSLNPVRGTIWLEYYGFDLLDPYLPFDVDGIGEMYVEPDSIWMIKYLITLDNWHLEFFEERRNLTASSEWDLNFGGELNAKGIHVRSPEDGQTAIWTEVRDSFGHMLQWFVDYNSGEIHMPIKLFQNYSTIYEDDLGERFGIDVLTKARVLGVYDVQSSPDYEIQLNLGPFGQFTLNGKLISNTTLLDYEDVESPHFTIHGPTMFDSTLWEIAAILEQLYTAMSDVNNERLTHKTYVDFQIGSGFGAAANYIVMPLNVFIFPGTYWGYYPSGALRVFAHELGHVFQGSRSNVKSSGGYYITGWFGESFATVMGREAMSRYSDSCPGSFVHQDGSNHFIEYLRGHVITDLAGRAEFVYYYLKQVYRWEIHQKFIRLWANQTMPKDALFEAGFNNEEAIITLYSFLAQENLAWLFRLIGFNITDERIIEGLELIEPSTIPTISITDCTVADGVAMINFTVSSGVTINMTEYKVDNGAMSNMMSVDGVLDETTEEFHLEINSSILSEGFHSLYLRGSTDYNPSEWVQVRLFIKSLSERYNIIALVIQPYGTLHASDMIRALTNKATAIWRWDTAKQTFYAYIPGFSSPAEDFELTVGDGYFVYLTQEAKLVEVGRP